MTKIVEVDVRVVCVPLSHPPAFSNRVIRNRYYALVRVTGDDGVTGVGFCYAGHVAGALVGEAISSLLGPLVIGQDAHTTEGIWERLYFAAQLHGRSGAVMRGLSALDIALWDRNARAAHLPLWRYLGGYTAGSVRAYASGGYYLDGKTPDGLAAEMARYVEAGFSAVKMKVGRLSITEDAQRIAAVRQAIGDDTLLMLDANNAWRYVWEAERALRAWERYDLAWIEEPFSPDDIGSHVRLGHRSGIPVATGEIEAGRWRFSDLIRNDATLILQPDAAVCGGITEFRRIAAIASSVGLPIAPHWFHDLHAHLAASSPNATYVEYFPDSDVLNFRLLIDPQMEVVAGQILLGDRPGLGFDYVEEEVARHALSDWVQVR